MPSRANGDHADIHQEVVVSSGEFSGWCRLPLEHFNNHVGPFYHRHDDGVLVCSFRAETKNTNANGTVHGGALLTLADYSMYVAGSRRIGSRNVVTVALGSEFLGAAFAGDLLEARTEVLAAGGSLVFLRGVMNAGERPVLNYSGTFKLVR